MRSFCNGLFLFAGNLDRSKCYSRGLIVWNLIKTAHCFRHCILIIVHPKTPDPRNSYLNQRIQ